MKQESINGVSLPQGEEKNKFLIFLKENWDLIIAILIAATFTVLAAIKKIDKEQANLSVLALLIAYIVYATKQAGGTRDLLKWIAKGVNFLENQNERNNALVGSIERKIYDISEVQISPILNSVQNLLASVAGFTQSEVIIGTENFYRKLIEIYSRKEIRTIDVTYFTPQVPDLALKGVRDYWGQLPKILKSNSDITFRRVATAENLTKFEWLLKDMDYFKALDGFHLRIIDHSVGSLLLNVILVNSDEVFIFGPHRPENERLQKYVYVKNTEIGSAVTAYYGLVWTEARIIKQGKLIFHDQISEILNKLKST